jgi:hypothetical protein
MYIKLLALPNGEPRHKVCDLIGEISAAWNKMTQEEQEEATNDAAKELEGHRKMQRLNQLNERSVSTFCMFNVYH